jgi:high affinity Mn2+ porin
MGEPEKPALADGARFRRIFRSILAVIFAVAAFESAHAAKREDSASQPPAFTWAGLYMGINFGAGIPLHVGERIQAGSGFTSTAFDLYPGSRERSGATFGLQAGYGWQFGNWAIGVGGDLNFLDGRGGPSGLYAAPPAYWPLGVYSYTLNYGPNAKYFASFRTRVGYAFDRTLLYVTGGVAAGGARGPATLIFNFGGPGNPFAAETSQSSRMKYILGAGIEYALSSNWSARLEYFFLSQSLNTQLFDNGSNYQFYTRTRNENNIVRFGLNYNLGPQYEATGNGDATGGSSADGEKSGKAERFSAHGQTTAVAQGYPKFPAPYTVPNSFSQNGQVRAGYTTNLFLGLRLWEGAAAFVNPEVDQGYGLSNSVGAAAYVNGAVAKVGSSGPYMRFQRYFMRQIIGLGGSDGGSERDTGSRSEALESTQNQLAGPVDKDRVIITLGKFSVGDVFDDNVYAHDPTTGFMNFAFNTMGAFDYAADSWGYTYGAALEWKQDWWTLRGGLFQLSQVPNGPEIEPVLGRQFMSVGEFEGRYELFGQAGALKFLAYGDNGYLSKYDEVTALAYATGEFPPSIENLRKRRVKIGGGINLKQQIAPGLGFFMRASMFDGRYETVDYTDVQRQLSMGLVAAGSLWDRPKDEIGGAIAFGGLSGPMIRYFGSGGTSVYIGDGALAYSGEKATELYYKYGVADWLDFTFDHQLIVNPGHNGARGPVNVFGVRMRAGF